MKYDPTLYKNRTAAENSKELMTNLKQVINDDAKISEIIKLLPSTIHFDINKYLSKFKDTILKIYGTNNKQDRYIKNTKPTKEIINSLNATEKKLFDLLLYLSGLGKNIGTNKDENITELKDRLKLVESQIRVGNNNPVVKKEMKEIIQKLYLYKVISHNNGKAYLKQF
jgi:hypothetical protein